METESGWSATISERIRLFAAGEWADLWRETVRVSYAARDASTTGLRESPEKGRIRRANALWEEGELARDLLVSVSPKFFENSLTLLDAIFKSDKFVYLIFGIEDEKSIATAIEK